MAQALTVQAPSLRPTVSSTYHAVPVVPVRFRVTPQGGLKWLGSDRRSEPIIIDRDITSQFDMLRLSFRFIMPYFIVTVIINRFRISFHFKTQIYTTTVLKTPPT